MRVGLGLALAFWAGAACAQTGPAVPGPETPPPPAPDYAREADWLCRPDRPNDACRPQPDGRTFAADPQAPVDCFLVYGTVSTDAGYVSDLTPGPGEARAAASVAPLAAQCRLFVPLYRQVTLPVLLARIRAGQPGEGADFTTSIADLRAAWRDYLRRDNGGRGVLLIGASQGAYLVQRLLEVEILPDARARRLLAGVIMPGHPGVAAPGGRFGTGEASLPICGAQAASGCVSTWSLYAQDDQAPRPLFARGADAACVNPAAPVGGPGLLRGWLRDPAAPTTETRYVEAQATGECVRDAGGATLRLRFDNTAEGQALRARAVAETDPAALGVRGFGLHGWDMALTQRSVMELVEAQGRAWARSARR